MPDFTTHTDKDGLHFRARSRLGAAFLDAEFSKHVRDLSRAEMLTIAARARAQGLIVETALLAA